MTKKRFCKRRASGRKSVNYSVDSFDAKAPSCYSRSARVFRSVAKVAVKRMRLLVRIENTNQNIIVLLHRVFNYELIKFYNFYTIE